MAGAAGCGAETGAGVIVDESVEGVTVLREETGTRTAVEPNAEAGIGFSVDTGAEPMFENGVVAGLSAVDWLAVRDDSAPFAPCSLSTAFFSKLPLPLASAFLPILDRFKHSQQWRF